MTQSTGHDRGYDADIEDNCNVCENSDKVELETATINVATKDIGNENVEAVSVVIECENVYEVEDDGYEADDEGVNEEEERNEREG